MRTRAQVEGDIPTRWETGSEDSGITAMFTILKLILEVSLDIREQDATLKADVTIL